jgi:hypothetical protein
MSSKSVSEHLLLGMSCQVSQIAKQILSKLERIPTLTQHEKQELIKMVVMVRAYQAVLNSGVVGDPLLQQALLLQEQNPPVEFDT